MFCKDIATICHKPEIKTAVWAGFFVLLALCLESADAAFVEVESKPLPPVPARHVALPKASKFQPPAVPGLYRQNQQSIDGPESSAFFGHTVASAGDLNSDGYGDVAVGGFRLGQAKNGAVIVYFGSPLGIQAQNFLRIECPTNAWHLGDPLPNPAGESSKAGIGGADFGHQVEGVGDVNGDGIADLIVGATFYSADKPQQGAAFLYYGWKTSPPDAPSWKFLGDRKGAGFGFSVAPAGDVNGDGFSDVVVGSPYYRTVGMEGARDLIGQAFLFLGSGDGLSETPAWTATSEQPDAQFGYSVHGAGDVNGDGFADVLVGAPFFFGKHAHVGKAYLYFGSATGLELEPVWTATGVQLQQGIAASVFTAGDINRDGFSDVVISANMTSHGQDWEGMLLVFFGSPTGLPSKPSWKFEPNQNVMYLGHSVATAGDLNGDGYDDLVASSFFGGQDIPAEGMALVFHGSKSGLPTRPNWTVRGRMFQSGFGATVRSAGDINGDGFGDMIIGQPAYRTNNIECGRAWIYYGSANGLSGSSGWKPPGEDFGFLWRRISIPYPNAVWTTVFVAGIASSIFYLTRSFYLRREKVRARLQEARETAQREERDRIAQDLHDQLGAQLTQIALASGAVVQAEGIDASQRLRQVSAVAGHLVDNLANLVWLTKPGNDTLEEMVSYLLNDVTTMTQAAGLSCELDVPPEFPAIVVSASLRHEVLLAVREAVHNVVKHAYAKRLRFVAALNEPLLTIEVADDGIGFDSAQTQSRGNGLGNLKARMARQNGSVRINSSPGQGTRIILEVSTKA